MQCSAELCIWPGGWRPYNDAVGGKFVAGRRHVVPTWLSATGGRRFIRAGSSSEGRAGRQWQRRKCSGQETDIFGLLKISARPP